MRRFAWALLLVFTFTIPWEYSLVFPDPFGNIARLAGIAVLLVAVLAVFLSGRLRALGPLLWLVIALYLWFCCSAFWTLESHETMARLRAYFQEMMLVWFTWEFADTLADFKRLLRAYVAGSWVLALLTFADFLSPASGQVRFVPEGQDPNDVARFLVFAVPMAALLIDMESRALPRIFAWSYLPVGLFATLFTASRSGFVIAAIAFAGCGLVIVRNHKRIVWTGALVSPVFAFVLGFMLPHETLARLATIPQQFLAGDFNQRWGIWEAGWQAFIRSPFLGSGAGCFVSAAGLAPADTSHNTALALLVEGGIVALLLASLIVVTAAYSVFRTHGAIRIALAAELLVWLIASLVASVQENRATWLVLGLIALAARLAAELPEGAPGLLFETWKASNARSTDNSKASPATKAAPSFQPPLQEGWEVPKTRPGGTSYRP